eukprot:TRINITY_DN4132_c0_g3_i2.p1 TRINITY_DN4132_c0_g3~~TRINITY_DN4132_c0_g3_i2.p1  ORF type:complete len:1229 (+),score=219.72 TRINITY_DN4132_c0_g3_i2:113-3799(+)
MSASARGRAADDDILAKMLTDGAGGRPPPIDVGAIDDDMRLAAIVEESEPMSFRGPGTPRLGQRSPGSPGSPLLRASSEGVPGMDRGADILKRSDDTALASLLTPAPGNAMRDTGSVANRVSQMTGDARLTTLVGLTQADRDDAALATEILRPVDKAFEASLLTPAPGNGSRHTGSVANRVSQMTDDARLTKLVGPTQADKDDAALVTEIFRPVDKASEVLAKIASLKEKRELREKDSAVLEQILAPVRPAEPLKEQLPAAASILAMRVRRVRTAHVRFDDLAGGSLQYFAAIGDATSTGYLLQQAERCGDNFFVNCADPHGRTALHHAAYEGTVEVADALLRAGADVLLRDSEGRTPLHIAASRGQVDVARLMLGTCVFRLRSAAMKRFRRDRTEPVASWEDPQLADQRAAGSTLAEYLRALEELLHTLTAAEDCYGFTCVHYAIRDAYAGCLPALKLVLSSLFEYAEGRETDEVMLDKRFQAQPGSILLSALEIHLLEHEVESIRREHVRRSSTIHNEIVNHRDSFGLTPLHYAASEGNYRAVHVLIVHGADLGAKAALQKPGDQAQDKAALQKPGEQVQDKEPDGHSVQVTPFDLAKDSTTRQALSAYPSRRGVSSLEAEAEAVVSRVEGNCEYVNEVHGLLARTPLHAAVFGAIGADDAHNAKEGQPLPVFMKLLEAHPECDPLVPDANGWTPIHFACAYGRSAELKEMLVRAKALHPDFGKRQADNTGINTKVRQNSKEPLQTSRRRSKSSSRCDWLLAPAGRQDAMPQRTARGREAEPPRFEPAKKERFADSVKARVQRRPRSAGLGGGQMVSPQEGGGHASQSWPQALSDGGCVSTSLGALMGRTPAHLAAQAAGEAEEPGLRGTNGHLRCLSALDEAGVLDLDRPDDRGLTPLLAACNGGAAAAVTWLLERSADCYAEDKTRRNGLHIACAKGHRRIVQILCCWDADVSRLKSSQDWKGRRPAELYTSGASRSLARPEDLVEDLATIWEAAREGDASMLQASLQQGASVDAVSPGGWTAAMYAARHGQMLVLRRLLSLKCHCGQPLLAPGEPRRSQVRPALGRGPLHLAAEAGYTEVCALLVRAGGSMLEERTQESLTALLSAASTGQLASLKMLVALRADPQVSLDKAGLGQNVFHLLAAGGSEQHVACIKWLSEFLLAKDAGKVAELLERQDKAAGLRRPVEVAKPLGRTFQALSKALRMARRSCDEEFERGAYLDGR